MSLIKLAKESKAKKIRKKYMKEHPVLYPATLGALGVGAAGFGYNAIKDAVDLIKGRDYHFSPARVFLPTAAVGAAAVGLHHIQNKNKK